MKKSFAVLAALLALTVGASPVFAKDEHHGGPWKELGLSKEQKEKMKKIHEESREKMKAVLTPEQQEKWKSMEKKHGGKKCKCEDGDEE